MSNPKISVIMIDGGFRERFDSLDFFANQTLPRDQYELLWVEYYDQINERLKGKISNYPNFKTLCLNRNDEYHSSYCFNAGILQSKGNLLVIPDADVFVEKNFFEDVLEEHTKMDNLVMYIQRFNEFEKDHKDEINLNHLGKVCVITDPANYGGCVTVQKKWLLDVNGYEQHEYFGTGDHANGLDMYIRFKNLGLPIMWHPKLKLFHPWHPGTFRLALSHRIQKMIIKERATNLDTLPFEGIDVSKNRTFPDYLQKKIETAMETEEFEDFEKN